MRKEKRFLPKKFPADVARFFNPQKSGTNEEFNPTTRMPVKLGTHQQEKNRERSYIPVYTGRRPARKVLGPDGKVKYVERERR